MKDILLSFCNSIMQQVLDFQKSPILDDILLTGRGLVIC